MSRPSYKQTSSMIKKTIYVSVCILVFLFIFMFGKSELSAEIIPYELDNAEIVAESALIMDFDTGEILWGKNINRLMYPASITKVMTGILAIEMIDDLGETVTISENASGRNSSFFAFDEGDEISAYDLLKAALINSQNNATVALAEHISGEVDSFISLMNDKAREIGAGSTIFENTSGLDSEYPHHRSTAEDLAVIARYAMQDDTFKDIVKIREDYIDVSEEEVYIFNTNKLLLYSHIKGIKTGFTNNAGHCIVVYSEKDGINLITVVLNSTYEQREKDVLRLLRWAYVNYENEELLEKDVSLGTATSGGSTKINVDIYPEEDLSIIIKRGTDAIVVEKEIFEDIVLPLKKGQKIGEIDVLLNGQEYSSVDLVTGDSYERIEIVEDLEKSVNKLNRIWVYIFLIGFYFFVFIFIIIRNLIRPKP